MGKGQGRVAREKGKRKTSVEKSIKSPELERMGVFVFSRAFKNTFGLSGNG
jgi:hypothetical protein